MISIITINLNNLEGLKRTANSIIQLHNPAIIEWIVIDGGSTDGSVTYIKSIEKHITYWISEPDKGIYHAMNKGAAVAKGDYLIFMNSGDYFAEGFPNADLFAQLQADVVYGDCIVTEDHQHFRYEAQPEELTLYNFYFGCICHQASFIRREVQLRFPYDERMRYAYCRKFFIESLILNNHSYKYINQPIAVYDANGVSARHKVDLMKEIEEYLQSILPARILQDYAVLREQKRIIDNSSLYPILKRMHPYRGWKKLFEKIVRFQFRLFFRDR